MTDPIVMEVEDEMSPEEVVLIVRHLSDQGFRVQVNSLDPLVLVLTEKPSGEDRNNILGLGSKNNLRSGYLGDRTERLGTR